MARYIYQGFTQDANGKIITGASVTVYLAGTTTAATIYTADSGGSAVTGAVVTSDASTGHFKFYVDEANYRASTKFDLVISKTNYSTTTLEDITVPGLTEKYGMVIARLSADQTGVADASYTTVALDEEGVDISGNFGSNVYTCPVDGYYQVNFNVSGTGVGGNIEDFFGLIADGSDTELLRGVRYAGTAAAVTSAGSGLLYCLASSVLKLRVYSNVSAGTTTINSEDYLTFLNVRLVYQ